MTLLALVAAVAAVGAAAYLATRAIVAALDASRAEAARSRVVALMAMFAPGVEAAQRDPRALLVWEPMARAARAVAADEMAALDRAAGKRFPFSPELIQAAHAQWTADWLAWEALHDAEYKKKARDAEQDRAALDAIEREKLDRYQRRYQEYVSVSKALRALIS